MILRRLGLAAPLAFLVAVLVHLALFGVQHAPGAEHADRLLTSLAAGLALAALGTVLFAALRKRRRRLYERPAPSSRNALFFLELAAGGTLAFALIELAEGHVPLTGGAWQFAVTAAVAAIVALFARYAGRLLTFSGSVLAAFASAIKRSPSPLVFDRARHAIRKCDAARPNACRGRAPPLFS